MIKSKDEYDSTYSIAYDILARLEETSNNNTVACQCTGNADLLTALNEIRTDIEGRTIIQEKIVEKPVEVVKEKIVEKTVTVVKEKIIEKVEIRYVKDNQTVSTEVEYRPQNKPCTCICVKKPQKDCIRRVIPAGCDFPKSNKGSLKKIEESKKKQQLIDEYKRITGVYERNIDKIHEFMQKNNIKDLSKIKVMVYYHSSYTPDYKEMRDCIYLPTGRYAKIYGR